jgi:serine/threonine protein phosphatase PrpC
LGKAAGSVATNGVASELSSPSHPTQATSAGHAHEALPKKRFPLKAVKPAAEGYSQPLGATPAVSSSAPPLAPPPPWGLHTSTETVAVVSVAQDANAEFRPYMEDGHRIVDPLWQRGGKERWGFFGVYDGHGGRREVDYVQETLHEVVLAELSNLQHDKDIEPAIHKAFVSAFAKIDRQLAMNGAWQSGCTCTVVLTRRHGNGLTLHVANVGDSRAVVIGYDSAKRLTVDHRAGDPAETKRIEQEGGIVRHGRVGGQLSVSRSLGDHHLKSSGLSCVPDVRSLEISQEHAVVIASDGLWDALEDDDARQVVNSCIDQAIAQGGDQQSIAKHLREQTAQKLVETAKEHNSRDNILALAAFF